MEDKKCLARSEKGQGKFIEEINIGETIFFQQILKK